MTNSNYQPSLRSKLRGIKPAVIESKFHRVCRGEDFMIELYHNDMSVCAQKARFALAEKKLKWEGHHLNLRAGVI